MAWNAWICDTQTGENRFRVNPSSASWERVINDGGGGQAVFQLSEQATFEMVTWDSSRPVQKTFVLAWDKYVVYAGLIWVREYDQDAKTLSVTHMDIWSIFKYRFLVLSRVNGMADDAPITWTGQSLANIAKLIVQLGTDAASAKFKMPIVYPADVAGAESRTYWPYHFPVVDDVLREIMASAGGPDVDFHPYWDDQSRLRYEMRIGNLNDRAWDFHSGAPDSNVTNLKFRDDATKVANTIFGIGEGSEQDIALRVLADPASPFPAMESQVALKGESDAGRMDSLISEQLRIRTQPTTQVTFETFADTAPGVLALRLGGVANIYYQNDPWIAKGRHGERVIRFSGDLTTRIKISGQQIGV